MINKRYSMAMSETLHYLKGISTEDTNKIPDKFIVFLKKYEDKEYECNFDYTKPLKELKLMNETRGLISMICLNYWCETDEQKESFRNHLSENEVKYQNELRKMYNTEDIFKKRKTDENIIIDNDISLQNAIDNTNNPNIIQWILKKIKKFFHINVNIF